jgi:hypothetical protein
MRGEENIPGWVRVDRRVSMKTGLTFLYRFMPQVEDPSAIHGLAHAILILLRRHGLTKEQVLEFVNLAWPDVEKVDAALSSREKIAPVVPGDQN